jgi:hypothetical protein
VEILFSINYYDADGDIVDKGIFIYFGNRFILKVDYLEDLEEIIYGLNKCQKEISESYPETRRI